MSDKNETRPFGARDKWGYLFGDFGNDFTFIFASSYLMVFYTKVWGISAKTVGILFLVSRCVDAFTDIGMGRIVDSIETAKDGRFRCWLRRMCGPVALTSFLMYQSGLAGASMTVKLIYMFVTYILWGSIFYTSINIPYGSDGIRYFRGAKRPCGTVGLSFLRSDFRGNLYQRGNTAHYLTIPMLTEIKWSAEETLRF